MTRAIDDWDWPEWLTCEWIARDQSGMWCAYESEPICGGLYWYDRNGGYVHLARWALALSLPDVPWQESKRRNPHRSEAT